MKTKQIITFVIIIILILITLALFFYLNSCPTCRYDAKKNICETDELCDELKIKLQNSKDTLLFSKQVIKINESKKSTIYFGIKNVYAQNLTLYPKINCTNSKNNKQMNVNTAFTAEKIYIEYNDTQIFPIFIEAPNEKEQIICLLKFFSDKASKELILQSAFLINVI